MGCGSFLIRLGRLRKVRSLHSVLQSVDMKNIWRNVEESICITAVRWNRHMSTTKTQDEMILMCFPIMSMKEVTEYIQ